MAITCVALHPALSACASAYSYPLSSASFPFARSLSPSPNPQPKTRKPPPPISISTNRSNVDALQLRALLAAANYSCHRFPAFSPDGQTDPPDPDKLGVALAHSSVVVSVFCRPKFLKDGCGGRRYEVSPFSFEDLFEKALPALERDRRLVGFGRAVSDGGLTASIHDVVVKSIGRLLSFMRSPVEGFKKCNY